MLVVCKIYLLFITDNKVCDSAPTKKDPVIEEKTGCKHNTEAKKRLKHHVVEIQLTGEVL